MELNEKIKLLCFIPEISTRILLETSLDPSTYNIEHNQVKEQFISEVGKRRHDIFLIDASDEKGDGRLKFLETAVSQQLKGPVRMLLLLDTIPPDAANQMQSYGPLCFIENFFTREKINSVLKQIMSMRDTGVRVKADPKFFDVTLMMK
ncbi:MAG: hypothetical protein WCX65_11340 [bacterium]